MTFASMGPRAGSLSIIGAVQVYQQDKAAFYIAVMPAIRKRDISTYFLTSNPSSSFNACVQKVCNTRTISVRFIRSALRCNKLRGLDVSCECYRGLLLSSRRSPHTVPHPMDVEAVDSS